MNEALTEDSYTVIVSEGGRAPTLRITSRALQLIGVLQRLQLSTSFVELGNTLEYECFPIYIPMGPHLNYLSRLQ